MMEEILLEMKEMGMEAPDDHNGEWDSNVITPGTSFMTKLSVYLWYYFGQNEPQSCLEENQGNRK